MKNLLTKLSIYLILLALNTRAYPQILIKCAGKDHYIPKFKSDTVASQFKSPLELMNVLQPVNNSKYDMEIRATYFSVLSLGGGMTISLKGNPKELVVETIRYSYANNTPDSLKPKGHEIARQGNLKYFYTVKTIKAPDTLLNSLIKNRLFDFDEKGVRDSLAKANVEIYNRNVLDGYSIWFDIKVKDKRRAFGIDPTRYPVNVKELGPIGTLDRTFNNLAGLTRQ